MALEHGDLFFVNRAGATYKIEALDLGDYLINNPLPGTTEYFVNDGTVSIANSGGTLAAPIELHSANTANNSILDFVDYFTVQRNGSGATVTLDFSAIKMDLLCDDGVGSGFKQDSCDCLALDFETISKEIVCPDGAIVNDTGCIELNICNDSPIGIVGSTHCLDIAVCDPAIDDNGCLSLNIDNIAGRLPCTDGGIIKNGDCLALDYGKILADLGLGVLTSDDNSIIFRGAGATNNGGDLTLGSVDLKVNRSVINGGGNGNTGGSVNDIIGGKGINLSPGAHGNLGNGDVTVNVDLCSGSGLQFDGSCLKMENLDDDGCWSDTRKAFTAQRIYIAKSGSANDPGIVLGTHNAANDDQLNKEKWWVGINSNQNNGSFALSTGRGWSNFENCGGGPPTEDLELNDPDTGTFGGFFSVACGYSVMPNHKTAGLIGQKGDPVVAFIDCQKFQCGVKANGDINFDGTCGPDHPHWNTLPDIWDGTEYVSPTAGNKNAQENLYKNLFHGSVNPYKEAAGAYDHFGNGIKIGRLNRLGFDKNSKFVGDFPEVSISDARVALGDSAEARATTIEAIIDKLGKFQSDGGLIRASLKTDSTSPEYPTLYIDTEELATIAPSLVEYSYTVDVADKVYDDDGAYYGQQFKDDLSNSPVAVSNVHYRSLTILSMAAHRIRKQQVIELQTKLEALEARLDAAGIP